MSEEQMKPAAMPEVPAGHEVAIFGAGCFWCVEPVFEQQAGVKSVVSGYTGGHTKNPSYAEICSKTTGHAEVVHVVFDPKVISYAKLVDWFWKLHDPTQVNRQGNDIGPQYRSCIFYTNEAQKKTASASKAKAQEKFNRPIATEITAASTFYPAEIGHQDYYKLNKNRNPYCRAIITPKLKKLELDH
ncbi:peptide-methionine (S)-S-oxide reductase MsrA [Persicirhabdus sediminis]|nr:peptide-methionine (S)-S-oxide reductase MsrA [Persicirhabdus sediminis]